MTSKSLSGWVAASALACSVAVAAQGGQDPPKAGGQDRDQAGKSFTVAGCVLKETDVLSRSAVAGNVGMADEFVLIRSVLNPPPASAENPPEKPEEPAATSGKVDFGKVYRMTGDKEQELKNYVGQKVEILGKFKHDEDAQRELGAAGTAGTSPKPGASVAPLTAENTPEITIDTIRPVPGSCPPAVSK